MNAICDLSNDIIVDTINCCSFMNKNYCIPVKMCIEKYKSCKILIAFAENDTKYFTIMVSCLTITTHDILIKTYSKLVTSQEYFGNRYRYFNDCILFNHAL